MITRPRLRWLAALLAAGLVLPGCTNAGAGTQPEPVDEIILADAYELGGYNPISGYGELGVSPIYEGLLGLDSSGDDALPGFVPVLASAAPLANADQTVWTVSLRPNVSFHDGSSFGPEDVVATYQAVLDADSASPIASAFEMIESVDTAEDARDQVVFTLKYPYADFPARLLLAIAPSELVGGGLATESSLNREPVGTGPYRLVELAADKAVFEAFGDYWGEQPQVRRLTTVYLPDDNTRVQRVAAGEFDGTIVPPVLAQAFDGNPDYQVVAAHSADWRGISFPADVAFTQDPQVRIALNHAVNRQAMIDTILVGHGIPAYTPVSPIYTAQFDPAAAFDYDVDKAVELLAAAGWTPGPDGVLTKGGERAAFTVAYRPTDTLRRDLATAFAADMARIGVAVTLEGLDFDHIEPRVTELGILLGGGDKPYSLDTQVFAALHTRIPGTAVWDNPGNYGSPELDALLAQARRSGDQATRDALYHQLQSQYLANPSYVFLVFLDHTYVVRNSDWQRGPLVVEPHAHGVSWGPWWDLAKWRR